MTSPRHAARCSFPPFDVPPLLVPGFVPSEVIALLPPGTHDAWASALTATLEEVARAVPILLWERPTSPHEWHERLDWVRTYLARLTPKFPERWAGLPPSRHAALLHLWKEMLAGIEVLWDADALPRRFGDEGRLTQPAAFTPLFHLLTTQPGVVRRLEPRDQRLRVRPPTDPPTLERALAIMRMLGHAPTASQRMLLVTKLPIAEILIRAADINVEAEHNLNAVAAGIAADIMTPPLYDAASERDRRYAPEMAANPDASKRYMWAVAERALDQIERAAQLEREPSAHWTDVVAHCRTAWEETAGDIAVRFSAGAADAEELSALEAFALWLLIRDVLLRSPRTELRADPHIVGNYNLGSALDLLDLLLNSPSASSYDAASQAASNAAAAAEYAATAAVRIAHAAAHRRLFAPVPELAILLAERRTPVRARTALFLAGSARRPEHLAQLLPLLSHIVVEAPRGDESRHVVRALLALGREGDAEAGETGEMKLERRTSALLTSWLGPLSEL
jgi:hypothetical protein